MKVCPECKSDMLEETSSTALRVVVCLILIFFIPFGIFFCWIPFAFPRKYACKNCGADVPTPQELDWREVDEKKQEYKEVQENKRSMADEKEVQVYRVNHDEAKNKEK
jgi:DNA-directed RNA polymerase subunit RPC12/RpoP